MVPPFACNDNKIGGGGAVPIVKQYKFLASSVFGFEISELFYQINTNYIPWNIFHCLLGEMNQSF